MAALTTRDAPSQNEYAGDEVSAVVLDPGYSSVRAGFAGEDTPKSIVPSYYAEKGSKQSFGDHVVDLPLEDVAIKNPYGKDGIVEDWDTAEELWKFSFASKLTGVRPNRALRDWLNDPNSVPNLQQAMQDAVDTERCLEEHPLFMTEPSWNPAKAREKCAEIALESWATPAFYLGRSSVMAAFAAGRHSALVVDIGASQMVVTPIHDGMILKKGVTRSNLAGNFLSSQTRNILATNDPNPIVITPHYLVKSKQPVDASNPANAIYRSFPEGFKPPQDSFNRYQEEKTVLEYKELMLQTWMGPGPFRGQGESLAREQMASPFEFPDGYNQLFSFERYKIVETLFDPQCYIPPPQGSAEGRLFPQPDQSSTIMALIKSAVNQVDVDIRPNILNNVVLTGASSMIKALPDRLQTELNKMYPSTRNRVHAAGMLVERRFGSWIGGSILASLGTFHQMWISKKEYDEHGAGLVTTRASRLQLPNEHGWICPVLASNVDKAAWDHAACVSQRWQTPGMLVRRAVKNATSIMLSRPTNWIGRVDIRHGSQHGIRSPPNATAPNMEGVKSMDDEAGAGLTQELQILPHFAKIMVGPDLKMQEGDSS